MTQAAFARHVGVRYHTFADWLQEPRRGDGGPAKAPASWFVELHLPAAAAAPS